MAKRKVTVTIARELRAEGAKTVTMAIDDAPAEHAERVGRLAALRRQLHCGMPSSVRCQNEQRTGHVGRSTSSTASAPPVAQRSEVGALPLHL